MKSSYGLEKQVEAVKHCRKLTKADMKLNNTTPKIEVDPESYHVLADGIRLVCDPADVLPLSQTYFLF